MEEIHIFHEKRGTSEVGSGIIHLCLATTERFIMPASIQIHSAFVALGSNKGNRFAHLENALSSIATQCGDILRRSSVFESTPLPVPGLTQKTFLNMVIQLTTTMSPRTLLERFHDIEATLGRDRENEIMWGPRTIDIDLITYDQMCSAENPILPHPRFKDRDFVLIPLQEIAPEFIDPETKDSLHTLLTRLPEESWTILQRVDSHEPLRQQNLQTLAG